MDKFSYSPPRAGAEPFFFSWDRERLLNRRQVASSPPSGQAVETNDARGWFSHENCFQNSPFLDTLWHLYSTRVLHQDWRQKGLKGILNLPEESNRLWKSFILNVTLYLKPSCIITDQIACWIRRLKYSVLYFVIYFVVFAFLHWLWLYVKFPARGQ